MDRDYYSLSGPSKLNQLFSDWCKLKVSNSLSTLLFVIIFAQVHLDIWHFMQRLACSCSSKSHPLYGTFMAKLSSCIY